MGQALNTRLRRATVIAGVTLLVLLVAWHPWIDRHEREDPITWHNFDIVFDGMTRSQVEGLLGRPHDTQPATRCPPLVPGGAVSVSRWFGTKGMIELGFDGRERVSAKRFTEGASTDHSTLD